jgi:hypothetical protein
MFVPLAWALRPSDDAERRLHRLAWLWIAGVIVFFSLSASKRSPYILPVAPAVAILTSGFFERWALGRLDPRRRGLALTVLVAVGSALVVVSVRIAGELDGRLAAPPELLAAGRIAVWLTIFGALAILGGALVPWRQRFAAPLGLLAFVAVTYLVGSVALLPRLDAIKSHRPFCVAIREHVEPDDRLLGYRLWAWRAAYSFYSGRQVRSLEDPDSLARYWRTPERVFLVVERAMLDEVRAAVDPGEPIAERGVGSNYVYLFANRPPGGGPSHGVPVE